VTQSDYDKKDIENYENLQKEYKELFTEYEKMKLNGSKSESLQEIVKKLTAKNKEIQELSAKLS